MRNLGLKVFPKNKDFIFFFYTDKPNGGNSKIISQSFTDSTIEVSYILNKGFVSPYIGLSFGLNDLLKNIIVLNIVK